jgi:uncharacterized protein
MIVDCRTHLMWFPDHVGERYAEEALASKLVKLKRSGGEVYSAKLDKHSYDAKPEDHWKASEAADKVIVFGLQAKPVGVWVPNEVIANYVKQHPEKLLGWASVDPNEPDCIEQLEYCVKALGLRGLKLGPVHQHFDPQDRKHWPFFKKCQQLSLPIMWHQGTTFPSQARLKWGLPLQLEDVAMVTAMEYGVENRILLGSDFPSGTISNVINGLRQVNKPVEGTHLPQIPNDVQDQIIYENWKGFFTQWL